MTQKKKMNNNTSRKTSQNVFPSNLMHVALQALTNHYIQRKFLVNVVNCKWIHGFVAILCL